jgi:hypothetical protein
MGRRGVRNEMEPPLEKSKPIKKQDLRSGSVRMGTKIMSIDNIVPLEKQVALLIKRVAEEKAAGK